jgi:hypothetical protein
VLEAENMITSAEKINIDLKDHQVQAGGWDYKKMMEDLHIWSEKFIVEFILKCTLPAIRMDRLRSSCYGHFRPNRNGFGLLNEIAINKRYIAENVIDIHVLGVLVHELLHGEQQNLGIDGKSGNYHNTAFINRAGSFGLIIDHYGHQKYAPPPTPFLELLSRCGIDVSMICGDEPVEAKPPLAISGISKQKLWICSCVPNPIHVRVAVSDFKAMCLKCGQLFKRKD